jgi:paraquat-inducible protein B
MSDPVDAPNQPRDTSAAARKSWWARWIWAVPIAAVAIVGWLLVRDRGIDATVVFDEAAGMGGGTKVVQRGINVGRVRRVELAQDGWHVIAELNLDKSIEHFLRSGTRFYLEGAHPSLTNLSSLKAIVRGPSIVLVAGPGGAARHFKGSMGPVRDSLAVSLPYLVKFAGPLGQLKAGSPVTLLGLTVGEVASVQLNTDAAAGTISAAVMVMLDPTRFHIQRNTTRVADWGGLMNVTMNELVKHGLRASLRQDPPLVGTPQITLEMTPYAGQGILRAAGAYVEIPAKEGGGLEQLLSQVGQLPIGAIGDNVRALTEHLKALASSPQLKDSIVQLDHALADLDKTVHEAAPQIAPTLDSVHQTVDSLRNTAIQLDATTVVAKRTISGATSPDGNLQQSLRELTEAARAIRSLANDLDQRPESLVRGR